MQYYIYKITNKINGKIYIGQHKVPLIKENFRRYMGKGIAIQEAIKKQVIGNNEDEYYFPADEIIKPLSNSYLKQFAKENKIKMQSQDKINRYSNILIKLCFVERLETIPDWDSLNKRIQAQSEEAYIKDNSYYKYKILTSSDIETIKSNCKKIDDYFWNNHQKPVVEKISKKLLDEIFKS